MASAPIRILVAPFDCYVAELGTAFPTISDEPGAFDPAWLKLGENGARNYDNEGVTLTVDDTVENFRGAGETAPQKAWRTEENVVIGFSLVDLKPEQFAKVLNDATVTTVAQAAGVAGQKHVDAYRGPDVVSYTLMLRGAGASTETLGLNAQIDVDQAYVDANPAPVFSKTGPAMLAVEFRAIRTAAGNFMKTRIQTSVEGS